MSNGIRTYWTNLLVDVCIAKNHRMLQGDIGSVTPIKKVDSILAGAMILRAISLLGEALENFVEVHKISVKARNPNLYHRLKALDDYGHLLDYDDIDSWRDRRNDVGHEVDEKYEWTEVDACLASVYRELEHLGILSEFPDLHARKTKERATESESGALFEQQITVEIYSASKVFHTIGWTVRVG